MYVPGFKVVYGILYYGSELPVRFQHSFIHSFVHSFIRSFVLRHAVESNVTYGILE